MVRATKAGLGRSDQVQLDFPHDQVAVNALDSV
jgi:hypothetical protein